MSSEIAWLVLIASVVTYIRCLLDAFAKSAESLRAHKEDQDSEAAAAAAAPPTATTSTITVLPASKSASKSDGSAKHTRKDLLEFMSAMLGISVALFGCMVAAYNLDGIAYAVPVAWGGTILLGLGLAVWASLLFAKYPEAAHARQIPHRQGPNHG
ncbi:hypothetical protein [Paenarthrobacter sp. NPDC089316]|uniref:hypothetical protein n=1 Tax=unclassified Paenarthrobacter TaxID=2634190 RepID=UPI00343E0BBD